MEMTELEQIARHKRAAIAADPTFEPLYEKLFVAMRFRPVYEDEELDADITAEVYQPTKQLEDLVGRGVLTDGGVHEGSAHASLTPSSGLEFKIGAELQSSADLSYLFARVHDLGKKYEPSAAGALPSAFPAANRAAPLRKFHLRTFLAKQREAGVPFESTIADFQLILFAASSGALPAEAIERTCKAIATGAQQSASRTAKTERAAALAEAERWLCEYAGLPVEGGGATKKPPRR